MKFLYTVILTIGFTYLFAQAQHDVFLLDKELESAILKKDLSSFIETPVLFICDTLERTVSASELSLMMTEYIPAIKKTVVKKASETNNGFVQSYGLYKDEDALYYIRFTLNPLTSKLEEVAVEKNR